ncbi:MFS transporter asaE like protein [Verticillium longisporum]|uniref:MFS transporter asaE like protein n=1 Tax=Verticillium longisporum TaxID=100787 RepID=A0A8I2ZGC8_VERLO|nr:MFS transporter asaE like protein [Verticillium longisporum]
MASDIEAAHEGNLKTVVDQSADGIPRTTGPLPAQFIPQFTTSASILELEYPDGGWTVWSQVIAGHLINSLAWGYGATYGIFQLYYTETLHLPEAQVSWVGSLQVFLSFVLCTISGRLSNAGYGRHAVFVGSLLAVLGSFAS